jgi:hypothetical protein
MSGQRTSEPSDRVAGLSDFVAKTARPIVRVRKGGVQQTARRLVRRIASAKPALYGLTFETGVEAPSYDWDLGDDDIALGIYGLYAVELTAALIRQQYPRILRDCEKADGFRQIAVFATDDATDLLLLLPPGAAPAAAEDATPKFDLSRAALQSAQEAVQSHQGNHDSAITSVLHGFGDAAARRALTVVRPRVVVAPAPAMELLASPWPSVQVACGGAKSTAGALAYRDGRRVVTVAYHGTGGKGTAISVGGQPCVIEDGSPMFDTAYAPAPDTLAVPDEKGRGGPMADRAPSRGETMRFCGCVSGETQTFIEGVDLGVPGVDATRMRCVQTRRDTNCGDSGAALINNADQIVGFAYRRTGHDEQPPFADWIWAKSVYDVLNLKA